jgi:hypothetical protein
MLIISLAIAIVIAMALMAIILMVYGNKEEEICSPINLKFNRRLLKNGEESLPSGKILQIVSDNGTHVSIVMACGSSVTDKEGNIFRIEGPYNLNCNETRTFDYIDKYTIWKADKCCG